LVKRHAGAATKWVRQAAISGLDDCGAAAGSMAHWIRRRVGAAGSDQRSKRCGGAASRVTHAHNVDALEPNTTYP
jgi:hypothetical protein